MPVHEMRQRRVDWLDTGLVTVTAPSAPSGAPTLRSAAFGVALFAVGIFVWAAGQAVGDGDGAGSWLLYLIGGALAVNGFIVTCGFRPSQRAAWWLGVPLGIALYLIGAASTGEMWRTLAATAAVVVLIAAFARSVLQLRAAQDQLATASVLEDRQRVAADVHDVVGHAMAVTMLHVNAARLSLPGNPDAAIEALTQAERSGRESMSEIRAMVRLLRSDEMTELTSDADASDVTDLIDTFRDAGATIEVDGSIEGLELSALTSVTLYRLVQEALTNAIKHGNGPVDVAYRVTTDEVEVVVTNPCHGDVDVDVARGGHGLTVARERVAAVGGTFDAGADRSGSVWRMTARLPR